MGTTERKLTSCKIKAVDFLGISETQACEVERGRGRDIQKRAIGRLVISVPPASSGNVIIKMSSVTQTEIISSEDKL